MAEFGERYYRRGDRKITLNFALAQGMKIDPLVLLDHFSPEKFLIKITPLNPTYRALANKLSSYINPMEPLDQYSIVSALRAAGFDVIISIGELEENFIGSNCGQYLQRHLQSSGGLTNGYTYSVHTSPEN